MSVLTRARSLFPRRDAAEGRRGTAVTVAVIALVLLTIWGVSFYWSREPDPFDVRAAAVARVPGQPESVVVGVTTTATLAQVMETLLDKPGGYLSNDVAPPSVFLDNMPNWEYGALVQARDLARALRNDMSRSRSQSTEDKDLARMEPQFSFQNDSWLFPSTEGEYRDGLKSLYSYLDRLADPGRNDTQFYARADNLHEWLGTVNKRLGSLSQRLSASVGQYRINTDLEMDPSAQQATPGEAEVYSETPWLEIDDVFFEARGATWALLHFLRAVEVDFREVLRDKNALVSLRQVIRELEAAQRPLHSPMVLNGSPYGIFANHSLTLASYVSRANAGVIDLRRILQDG